MKGRDWSGVAIISSVILAALMLVAVLVLPQADPLRTAAFALFATVILVLTAMGAAARWLI